MKIAINDYSFPSPEIEEGILRPLDYEVVAWKEKRTAADLPQLVADADAVITQFAPVNADVIASKRQAKVIVRHGINVDNVDLAAARDRSITVCNVPDYCIDEVAGHTLAFIPATTRQVRGPWLADRRRKEVRPARHECDDHRSGAARMPECTARS